MGFFSGLGSALKSVVSAAAPIVGGAIGGPFGAAIGSAVGGGFLPKQAGTPSFVPGALPRTLSLPRATTSRRLPKQTGMLDFLPDIGVPGPGVFTPQGCPPGFHLAKDGSGRCVRNRRMNPLNHKANMRAARRLVAFRKAVVRTEKALRKAVPPSARRRAPAGHRARLTHQ